MVGERDLKLLLRSMEPELWPEVYGFGVAPEGQLGAALTARGISANVVAGFYHDHVFVPWPRRDDAMAALWELSDA